MAKALINTRNGRKFRMGLYAMLCLTIGLAAVSFVPGLAGVYAIYASGLGGLYVVYCGGNVGNKWVLTRPDAKVEVSSMGPHQPSPDNPEAQ